MAEQQDKRNWVNFEPNVPTTVQLESDPRSIAPKKKTGDYGDYLTYYHKAVGGKMFAATEILQKMLVDYQPGDKVTITRVYQDGKTSWTVAGNKPDTKQTDVVGAQLTARVNNIEAKLDQVLKYIYGDTEKAQIPEGTGETKDATELGF